MTFQPSNGGANTAVTSLEQPYTSAVVWLPQEGPQVAAAICPCDETFFGGTRGGGKTDAALGRHVAGAERYGSCWNGLLIRRKYKDLAEVRRRIDEMISSGMAAERIGGENQVNYVRWENGAVLVLAAIHMLKQAEDYQGQQFTEITIDEAPAIPFIGPLVDLLKGCLRSPHGVPCHMFLTGNPGGAGSSQIKVMYIPMVDGGESPVAESEVHTLPDGSTRTFIRSTLADNQILEQMDPGYRKRLESIKDPNLRAAWLMGLWNVFVGQAFKFTSRHIIEPIWPIPDHAPVYMTFDWGYGAPFSIGWWWVDGDNRVYRFAEWYGWNKVTPNVGLRLTDPQLAEGILEREKAMGLDSGSVLRYAGPDCWSKKPDYKGGGQGPSTAEEFTTYTDREDVRQRYGKHASLEMYRGDPSQTLKIRQFRTRLDVPEDLNELPMLVVYKTCRQFIRIIPDLCVDELTAEYLEPGQELHPFDESCHICMARPVGVTEDTLDAAASAAKAKAHRSKLDTASRMAMDEHTAMMLALKSASDIDGMSEMDIGEWMLQHLEDTDDLMN